MQEKPMRRKDRQRSREEGLAILKNCEYGILSTVDADGQPYGTPLSYIVKDNKVYFHSAMNGHKIDNIKGNPKACFTVVGGTKPVYADNFSTYFESVVIFGNVSEVSDEKEKYDILYELAERYLPDYMDKADGDIKHSLSRTAVYGVEMEVVTVKAKR
ncbi:MFS transporter [Deltaproteobacteria bacterium Smac51]|nr:MFS transporter [Deltaproteobacteria bacterium Smac51]